MRIVLLLAVSLAACSSEPKRASLAEGSYAGAGRDRLCIAGPAGSQRAGFITFGDGDTNCTARGRVTARGAAWQLTPTGDADCHIPLSVNAGTIALGPGTPACAYYCGPDARFDGRAFTPAKGAAVGDFAGDRLC